MVELCSVKFNFNALEPKTSYCETLQGQNQMLFGLVLVWYSLCMIVPFFGAVFVAFLVSLFPFVSLSLSLSLFVVFSLLSLSLYIYIYISLSLSTSLPLLHLSITCTREVETVASVTYGLDFTTFVCVALKSEWPNRALGRLVKGPPCLVYAMAQQWDRLCQRDLVKLTLLAPSKLFGFRYFWFRASILLSGERAGMTTRKS